METGGRQIGLFSATMLVAGNMIGSGIFMMPTTMASIGGIASLGWLVAVPGAFVIGYVFARLAQNRPLPGGPYAYAREGLGDFAGFQCNLLYWFSNVVANIAIATSITGYLAYFFPVLRQTYVGAISTATVIWLAALLNIVGPRLVTRFEAVTTLLGVGPIALVGLVGWFYFDPQIFQAGWNPTGKAWPEAVGSAFSIMFWAFMGVECASVAAGVVENPQRNVPRATLLGVLIAALIYVLATTAIMGMIPNEELRHSTAPFADATMRAIGPIGAAVISVCAIMKAAGCLGGWTLTNAQAALAAAQDGLFPAAFCKTNARGVPALGLVLVSILMTLVLLATLAPDIGGAFTVLADISVLLVLTPYIFAAVAVSYYVQTGVLSRSVVWAAILTVVYCLTVVTVSAGTAVAVSMLLGLSTAPLFGALIATRGRKLQLNPAK